ASARLRGLREIVLRGLRPRRGQLALHAPLEFGGELRELRLVLVEFRTPLRLALLAALACIPTLADVVGNDERLVFPTELLARRGNLIDTQRGAVGRFRTLLVR